MNFIISRETLLPCLQMINGVVERRHTLPILSNFLLSITGDDMTLTGTDMEVELIARIPEGGEKAELTLPARKLLDICRALPETASLDFSVKKDQVTMKSGKSRFTLATLPASEFPSTEITAASIEFSIPQKRLRDLIEDTQFAMAQQDVRYYLNGLLLEIGNNTLRAVATDGHRLAMKDIEQDTGATDTVQVIIPRKGVTELLRLLGGEETPARVQVSSNHIRVVLENLQFTSKLIDGRFPDYERVVPDTSSNKVVADRDALRQSLTRASILSNEKYKGVRLALKENSIKALAHNPEHEEAEEELEVDYSGDEMEIGFNVSYLLDALSVIKTDKVNITIKDPNSSCLLLPDDEEKSKYVVMPMRL